jgi:hypothetical protein
VTQISLAAELDRAIEELKLTFAQRVSIEPDQAGAIVHIDGIELGLGWSPNVGVLSFLLPFHYPDAAIYPYYVTGASAAAGVGGGALQPVTWRGAPATQVSLRHTRWNPALDTALGSVLLTQARLLEQ